MRHFSFFQGILSGFNRLQNPHINYSDTVSRMDHMALPLILRLVKRTSEA